ncbi:hypothetical protein CERSUDRAFT_118139 [Gelatoporia subvermispora B]|uniref:Uncharacterized protein n=1 Tax=Ceriporiopsis subvermispora (strain B) TaxID=914234 RepID=M2QLP5_CERS8|nr:hypothetical protein CERSUDRAFT_118139 [Gelatoporia subvermispora B]
MARASQKSTPDLITYRYKQTMAYVKPADDHSKAAEYAREVFTDLSTISDSRISFSITVRVQDKIQTVMITPRAWRDTMSSLAKFEIVDISVTESRPCTPSVPTLTLPEYPPPEYSAASEKHTDAFQDEKHLSSECRCSSQSRSPSPSSSPRSPLRWFHDRVTR